MIDILQIESDDYVKYIGADTKPYSTPLEKVEMDLQRAEFNMKFKDFINKLGFDSIKYRNTAEPSYAGEDPYSYILFEPEQFKLSSSKSFNAKDPRHGFVLGSVVRGATQAVKAFAPKKASGLFSEAEKAAQQLQGSKPRAGQSFLNEMKGVTSDELEWTGAKERFGNNNPTTKEEVQQFFEDNDFDFEVQVGRSRPEKIEAVDDMPTLVDDELDVDDRFWAWAEENYPHDVDMLDDLVDNPEQFDAWFNSKQEEFFKKTEGDFTTQSAHLDYSFEGKDTQNYRELVISIPDKYKKVDLDYQHTVHHPASKNQIAHVRLADIDQADDAFTKTLLVDEIQSDAHQTAGGKEGVGYLTKEKANAKALKQQELEDRRQKINALELSEEEKDKLLDELLADAQNANVAFDSSNVPDLPLKKDKQWGAVGLRQAMKVAAEEGYDQVALTTGRLQAERNRKIMEATDTTLIKTPSGRYQIDSDVSVANEQAIYNTFEEAESELKKYLGEKNAQKLIKSVPEKDGDRTYWTLDEPHTVKRGGQKYMDFYDRTLQKIWKRDFAKKYGVDVKMVEYKQGDKTVQLPTLEMTEKMRADILKGLKMFAEGGYVIQKGDTLSEIARDEGMTVAEIAKLNNIKDVNKIYAGQTLTFGQDMSTDISNKAEIIKESEPVIESKQDVFEGVPEKISDITSSIAEKSDVVIDTVESTADKLSDVSKNVQSTVSETFDDVKETVSSATGRTLSALRKLVGSDFSSRGRTAENTTGTTAAPKPTSIMGDMTMEQVREANTPDAPDLSDVKMPDVDFSSEGRTAENTAGTTEEPKEIKLPAIEFKPRDIEIESEKQMEDQESLVDTPKRFL